MPTSRHPATSEVCSGAFLAESISRTVGSPGDLGACDDPYHLTLPCDDLLKGWGTPPGFELRTFYVEFKRNDPRLTADGIILLGQKLRVAAFKWLRNQVTDCEGNITGKRLACRNPRVFVTTHDGLTADPLMANYGYICVEVYAYDVLAPPILGAGPNEVGEPVDE